MMEEEDVGVPLKSDMKRKREERSDPKLMKKTKIENDEKFMNFKNSVNHLKRVDGSCGQQLSDESESENLTVSKSLTPDPTNELPVWNCHSQIIESIKKNQVTVIVGETGSGKTTQIPQMLLSYFQQLSTPDDQTTHRIAITQPRRVAAISLATRVLSELKQKRCQDSTEFKSDDSLKVTLGHQTAPHQQSSHQQGSHQQSSQTCRSDDSLYSLGGLVGYSVRFKTASSSLTQIKFLTDGMLLREAMVDRCLRRYRVVIVDEVHERSLRTDILLGILKTLLQKRKNLRIVVMSATLDYRAFTNFFGQGGVVLIPGRQHHVTIHNTVKQNNKDEYLNVSLMITGSYDH